MLKRACALCIASVLLLCNTAFGAAYATLRRGDVSDEVLTMKTALAAVGYSLEINNVFDPTTEALVRAFQRTHGLTVDGVAGSDTLERLYAEAAAVSGSSASASQTSASSASSDSLRYGSSGSGVTALQNALRTLGYSLTADGKYGSGTVAAVKAFQRAEGLTADGVAGQETLTRLYTRASQAAVVTAVPTVAPTQTVSSYTASLTARVTTSGGSLNLRQSASGTARVIASIPNGTYLTVLNYGTTWSEVVYSGRQGYVMTRFITLTGSGTTVYPSVTSTPYIYITPTPASQGGSSVPAGYAYVVTGGGALNLRSAATENSQVVITIPNGALVRVLASSTAWSQIYYRGYTGYVMTGYLSASSAGTVTNAPTATPQATRASSCLTARVTTSGGSLNLRESASSGARVLTGVPNGAYLSVTDYGSAWCAVVYGSYSGYVMTRYLTLTSGGTSVPVTAAPTSVPSDTGITARVTTSGGSLNLRQQPSPGSQVLASIPNSTVLSVSAYASIWCRVSYGNYDGYVMTKYLTLLSGATATPTAVVTATPAPTAVPSSGTGLYAQVTGGSLNLRSAASAGSQVVTVLPSGAFLTVTSYGPLWSAVTYGTYSGYVMTQYIRLYSSGQATDAPYATVTPAATQTASSYDPSIFTRTLRSGYTGTDVTLVQKRLAELNYLSSSALSGTYDSNTMTAVKLFQKMHGLSQDGLAGTRTFALLFSASAISYSGDISDYTTLHIYYSTVDTSLTASVQKMQRRLKELGYTCNVTGRFDETTYMAVLSFQLRNGVSVTGAADPATQLRLYSSSAKGPTAAASLELEEGAGYISGPTVSLIRLLHWYNTVKPALYGGNTLLVYDPTTHLSWNLRVMSCGRHADCEPLTLRDTLIMFRALGQPSWTVHPVYVQLPDGNWTMATMHDRPHLTGSLSDNGFDGHLCVHFLRDMDEAQQNDPNYGVTNQNTLREAWKALTGETVN